MENDNQIKLADQLEAVRKIWTDPEYVSQALRSEQEDDPLPNLKTGGQNMDNDIPETEQDQDAQTYTDAGNIHIADRNENHDDKVSKGETAQTLGAPISTTNDRKETFIDTSLGTTHDTVNAGQSTGHDSSSFDAKPTRNEDVELEVEEEVGSRPEVRHLYAKEKPTEDGDIIFTTTLPVAVGLNGKLQNEKTTRSLTKTFAIAHYHQVRSHTLRGIAIEIHSPELNGRLSAVLEDYPSVDTGAPVVGFNAPFIPFLHRWDRLLQAEATETNDGLKKLLSALKNTLEPELSDSFHTFHEFKKTGYVTYKDILLAFEPGSIVVETVNGIHSAAILNDASTIKMRSYDYCQLSVEVLDWNGITFGFRNKTWKIHPFKGFRKITTLPYSPLTSHPDQERIRQSLIERGRRFEALSGQHMRMYSGSVSVKYERSPDRIYLVELSERIIVDAYAYYRFQEKVVPVLRGVGSTKNAKIQNPPTDLARDDDDDEDNDSDNDNKKELPRLTDEQCLLARPRVKGFALESKQFHKFYISGIGSISWNDKLLGNLVIEEHEKQLLLALVAQNMEKAGGGFDDFVEGKGKGLILLLAGPPGVGKTLTAESVAEQLRRPLYRVRAGDLGFTPGDVEGSLKRALDRCSYWDAVLLIDEADVFLERRSSYNLAQNELVSIFLVLLEYYQGVLVLTTNRTENVDPAFESRIDIILTYDQRSQDARRRIWANFVSRLPPESVELSEEDLDHLARWLINGRQIKSAIKTARILALSQKARLGKRHLDVVLNIRRRGSKLLDTGYGGWDSSEPSRTPQPVDE